jgi:hypothetical protein
VTLKTFVTFSVTAKRSCSQSPRTTKESRTSKSDSTTRRKKGNPKKISGVKDLTKKRRNL